MREELTIEQFCSKYKPESMVLQYNADGADVLEVRMLPGDFVAQFETGAGIDLLGANGRRVFSGLMPSGVSVSNQAGAGLSTGYTFTSDWHLLERTAYLRMNGKGEVVYPGRGGNFVDVSAFAREVFEWATGWQGSKVGCVLSCPLGGAVPVPEGNGMTSCGALIGEAARWIPGAMMVERYGSEPALLRLTHPDLEGEVVLTEADNLLGVSLQKKDEAVPPVCALVGGAHMVLPEGGDVREPGAFVYAVPVEDGVQGMAGGSVASQKMVVAGVALPERYVFERGESEGDYRPLTAGSKVLRWVARFFPEFVPFLEVMEAGAAFVDVVPRDAIAAAMEESADEDAAQVPANYSEPPWSDGASGGMYVLTEGSFAASARQAKNLKGLRWCKARVCLNVRAKGLGDEKWKPLLAVAEEVFPGRVHSASGVETYLTARLVMDCVLVNKGKRVYDPATNAPCSADPEFVAEEGEAPLASEYRAALQRYFEGTREVPYEGQVSMLYRDDLRVDYLAGKRLRIVGMKEEWERMYAVIRSVQWDVTAGIVTLSVGGAAATSFDEHLQRLMLARRARVDAAQRAAVPFDVADVDGRAEAEDALTVSPSVSASVSGVVAGRKVKPWTLYTMVEGEGDEKQTVVWLAGGTLKRGGQVWHVEDTRYQIVGGQQTQMPWRMFGGKPRLIWRWDEVKLAWSFDILQ